MRLGTWLQHLDLRENASLAEQWAYGNRSILGGLVGAWLGVHVAKRLCGYRLRTGDLFAPAVALGMAVGRIGCFLTEPLRSTGGHNVSFVYEIAFHLAAFAVIYPLVQGRELGLPTWIFGLFAAGLLAFAAFGAWEWRHRERALIYPALLRNRAFTSGLRRFRCTEPSTIFCRLNWRSRYGWK